MTNYRPLKMTTLLCAVLCIALVSGCSNDTSQSTETNLEVADVQGVSFDDVAPTVEPTANDETYTAPAKPESKSITAAPTPITPPTEPTPAIKPATAADVPDDISKIPSFVPDPAEPTPQPTPAEEVKPAPKDIATATAPGSFEEIAFKLLSDFEYVEPIPHSDGAAEEPAPAKDQIPASVKALSGKMAAIEGWMVPMEINDDGSVKSFVLVKTQPQCCFGDAQAMNEWVDVMMKPGHNAEFSVDTPVKVYGQFEVGEKKEDGFVLSIYRMKGDRVDI